MPLIQSLPSHRGNVVPHWTGSRQPAGEKIAVWRKVLRPNGTASW